ncbi:hypothetical protein BBD39_10715 [Arsenophonus endosymbiont of Bemisia tabaci Asia II 3]|nr:hypothetical protein BBD39_10715 [Arsenophonus endosymbiont of Bemisia tabaci Asia II 3]
MNTLRSKEFKRSILDNEVSTEIDTIKAEEEKIKIKKWKNKQRAREKLLRDTVRKAARHAQKEA